MNKKYLPSALILYLNYFIHGVGCSILGQAVIKEALAAAWGVEAMAITAISAALGLGRLIALPFAGPLSDKLGRRISTAIGSASYAIYLIGLALAFNAGTHGGYTIAYVCAIIGGIANSFLDTGIYPAVSEIIYKAPSVATMGIKFFIAIAQMLLPFVLGVAVTSTAAGFTSYNPLFYGCGIAYIVLFVLVFLFPLPDADQKASGKKRGSDRQPEAYPFLFRVHRHDPDRIHLHRYLPAVAELCAELCKRKCRLGESVHHADLLFSRNHAGTRCNRIPDQKNQRRSFHRCLPGYLPCNNDRCPDGTE
mgnify:FL=1